LSALQSQYRLLAFNVPEVRFGSFVTYVDSSFLLEDLFAFGLVGNARTRRRC
jgi:hypothetical protein